MEKAKKKLEGDLADTQAAVEELGRIKSDLEGNIKKYLFFYTSLFETTFDLFTYVAFRSTCIWLILQLLINTVDF